MDRRSSRGPLSAHYLAPVALLVAVVAVAVAIGVSTGGSGDGGGNVTKQAGPQRKAYVVKPGDQLAGIAERTEVPLERLIELNPKLDPQELSPGQRVRLR